MEWESACQQQDSTIFKKFPQQRKGIQENCNKLGGNLLKYRYRGYKDGEVMVKLLFGEDVAIVACCIPYQA